jgi:hypothetical protein
MRRRIGLYGGRVVWTDGKEFFVFLCATRFAELAHAYRAIDEGVL